MGLSYCTAQNVRDTAVKYVNQMEGGGGNTDLQIITTDQIEAMIADASDFVRSILQPRYLPETIDGYDPDFPPVVVTATKVYAAILLYQRFGALNEDADAKAVEALQQQLGQCVRTIGNGLLQTDDGTVVPQTLGVTLYQGVGETSITRALSVSRY